MTLFGIKKTYLLSILTLLSIVALSSNVFAQVGSNEEEEDPKQERPSLSLDFGITEVLGGIYYNDPLGLQLATSLLPYEGIINPEIYLLLRLKIKFKKSSQIS